MKKTILIILLLFTVSKIDAQSKIFNNWVFGDRAGLNFNTTPPSFINNCVINSIEGSASISDSNGALLFYSDGEKVWNKNHILMPNGGGLLGHSSATQGANIVPFPGHPNLYYLFAINKENGRYGGCACISYSIIDMNLNGGLGDVTLKNTILHTQITEKLAVVKHQNDTSYWVVAHEYGSDKYMSYLIDTNGINIVPVVSSIGTPMCCHLNYSNSIGQMKISPDCSKICSAILSNGIVELFDFSSLTGQLTNSISIAMNNPHTYGVEFSPDSKLIYVTGWFPQAAYLWQLNISSWNASSILSSLTQIYYSNTASYGQLQLGPDNKIYCANNLEFTINVINNPNTLGWQCDFQRDQFPIYNSSGFGRCGWGLPNRISDCRNNIEINSDTICDITIPNVITPNNDSINDIFSITCKNIKYFPADLVIYNRWGQEVFNEEKKLNYISQIPDGAYYYMFSYQAIKHKGFLQIFH